MESQFADQVELVALLVHSMLALVSMKGR